MREAEKILLAQIEDFRPDLVINQDIFHIDTAPDAAHQGDRPARS